KRDGVEEARATHALWRAASSADCRMQSFFIQAGGALQAIGDARLVDCQDFIADQGQFAEIAGANEDTAAAFGKITDQSMNLHLRSNINALRRLVKQQYPDRTREPFCHDHLLLI